MKRFASYVVRIGACVFLLVVYIYAWRPVRLAVSERIIHPVLANAQIHSLVQPYSIKADGVALHVSFRWGDESKTIQYRPQFGFFFLLSLMTLVIVAARPRWYAMLLGLHVISIMLTAGLMLLSRHGWYSGFIAVDLIATYLTPVLSLAIAAWASGGVERLTPEAGAEI